ncbi:MAG: D-2-hydroxyacid dehydrogenase [Chloroflexi bacterium]|nr:D-2-hydroxyacid dehydrogenase [Chloroflexota bacterium]
MRVIVPDYLAEYLLPRMRAVSPEVELLTLAADASDVAKLGGADALLKWYIRDRFPVIYGPGGLREILRRCPGLKWFHVGRAGVEDVLIPEIVESDITLTNGAGMPKLAMAETVLAFILADTKVLYDHFRLQQSATWGFLPHRELPGLTVAIIGLGNTGLEIARLCKAMGMRVTGTKRRVPLEAAPNVDEVFPSSRHEECLAQADFVVVACALTPETHHLINARILGAMKTDAALINVARGSVVEEEALIEALRSNTIRAAYLDVFENEPLPPESPLYKLPNAIVMPHNSPFSQNLIYHMADIFLDNFGRYCSGRPLINVVDKRAGY